MTLQRTRLGPYRLLQLLGSGVAGDVFLVESQAVAEPGHAQVSQQPQRVALKVVHGDVYMPIARSLLDQVSLVARQRHPNVAPVYEVGELDGLLYVTMAHHASGSLATLYRLAGGSGRDAGRAAASVPAPVVASLIWGAAQALAAVHRVGVIHGDLKPQNIFITHDATQKPMLQLADFGQSQYVEASAARHGWGSADTLLYTAPEQIAGETVTASDQYSLAGIAYLLLTGEPPLAILPDNTVNDARHAVLPSMPIPAHVRNPEVSSAADDVLLRALAREPIERYPSVLDFADALNRALGGALAPTISVAEPVALATPEPMETQKHLAFTPSIAESSENHGQTSMRVSVGAPPAEAMAAGVPTGNRKSRSLAAFWHFVSYVLVGVVSTVVNLVCFQALYVYAGLPYTEQVRYLIGYLGSAEIATMFNFILNDRFTFARYDGRHRPWLVRCLRFHSTVINGFILTFLVSGGLHYEVGVPALMSQAAGIFVAFVFNYTFHHIWTYRARKRPATPSPDPGMSV